MALLACVAVFVTLVYGGEVLVNRDKVAYFAVGKGFNGELRACATAEECRTEWVIPCLGAIADSDAACTVPNRVTSAAVECRLSDRDLGSYCKQALRKVHGWPKQAGRFYIDPVGGVDVLPWLAALSGGLVLAAVVQRRLRRRRSELNPGASSGRPASRSRAERRDLEFWRTRDHEKLSDLNPSSGSDRASSDVISGRQRAPAATTSLRYALSLVLVSPVVGFWISGAFVFEATFVPPESGFEKFHQPWSLQTRTIIGWVATAIALMATFHLLARHRRTLLRRRPWYSPAFTLALAGTVIGFTYRMITAPAKDANLGAGLMMLVCPTVVVMLVGAAIWQYRETGNQRRRESAALGTGPARR